MAAKSVEVVRYSTDASPQMFLFNDIWVESGTIQVAQHLSINHCPTHILAVLSCATV